MHHLAEELLKRDGENRSGLPLWLKNNIPESRPPYVLSRKDKVFELYHPDGTVDSFDSIIEAYDSVSGTNIVFDDNIDQLIGGFVVIKEDPSQSTSRALLDSSDVNRVKFLVDELDSFKDTAEGYRRDRYNPFMAYIFINSHPALWTKNVKEESFYWNTFDCVKDIYPFPCMNDDGSWLWSVEWGEHADPDYTLTFFDPRLTVTTETIEKCYVGVARILDYLYDDKGVLRSTDTSTEKIDDVLRECLKNFEQKNKCCNKSR